MRAMLPAVDWRTMKTQSAWLLFALGSAAFGGATAILAKVGVAGIDSNLATFYRTLVVLVFAGLIVSAQGTWSELSRHAPGCSSPCRALQPRPRGYATTARCNSHPHRESHRSTS